MQVLPDPTPGPGEVRIAVRATAVNRADLLQCRGSYPPPPGASDVLGLEAAGVIDAVADDVDGWAVGDRVMAVLAGGGYAERVVVPAGQVMAIPTGMDFVVAAAVCEAYLTAWQALGAAPRPAPGTRLLVHAAASSVGLAALDIAQALGATTIATTRDHEKADTLADLADHVIVPGPDGFADDVMRITDGHGADAIIDLVGAAYWTDNVASIAMDGRIFLIGLLGGTRSEVNLGALLARRVSVIGSTLRARPAAYKAELVASFAAWGLPRLAERALRPRIHDIFPLQRVADAHRVVAANQNIGKVVLLVSEDGLIER